MIITIGHLVNKTILLRTSQEVALVIRDSRYIGLLNQYACRILLVVEQPDLLRSLLESSFDRLRVIADEVANCHSYDLTIYLEQLPSILRRFGDVSLQPLLAPYLKVPEKLLSTDKDQIGLALYGRELNEIITSETIVNAMPINKRHNTVFTFFPSAQHKNGKTPDCFECSDAGSKVHDYSDIAALIASVDMVVGFENDITHLAGALGKPVWLLKSSIEDKKQDDFSDYYSCVSTFYKEDKRSWEQVLHDLFLYQSLKPSEPLFVPFNLKDVTLPCIPHDELLSFPDKKIETTGQLQELFDLDVTIFTSVSVETTTVCNLSCSYCPHSTAAAKAPAFMSDDVFYHIIDSLKEFRPDYSGQIVPSMYGEPLLDKRLENFIGYIRLQFPNANIDLFTNGTFMTVERYNSLKDAGINKFNISIHTPEMSSDLSRVLNAVQSEFSDRDSFNIMPTYYSDKFNRGGLVEGTPSDRSVCKNILRCSPGFQNMDFDYLGNAILCCNDYLSENIYANIANESIEQIWNSALYRNIRNKFLFGYIPLPICRRCLQHQ